MKRRAFVGAVSGMLFSLIGPSLAMPPWSQEPAETSQPDADCYAIWSILISILRPTSRGYLLPVVTAVPEMITEMRSDPPRTLIERAKLGVLIEVDVAREYHDRFREAAEDLKLKRQQVVRLERKFTLPHPYRLLDAEAMKEYGRLRPPSCVVDPSHPWHRDHALEKKFAGFSPPVRFSKVFFDGSRSLGLVWAASDGGSTTYCFGRDGRQWRHLDWSATAIAVNC